MTKIKNDINAIIASGANPDVEMPKLVKKYASSGFSRLGAKANFAADAREVGNEILRQLGGGRFMSMVGGKNAMYGMFGGKPGLQVSIGKGAEGGINRVIITLDPATDTYRMEFWKIAKGGMSTQKVSEASMVYADDLQRVFTNRTKFYTSMSRPGVKAKFAADKRTTAGALRKALKAKGITSADDLEWHGISPNDPDSTPYWLYEDGSMEKIKSSRSGAKTDMSKATDALAFIKSSIESGKTVYIQTPRGATKVTPKTYAKFEALGRPLFKIGTDGALLMSSGSSYVRLTMGEDEMLVRVSAMSRPGAKAKMAASDIIVKKDAQYIYYYPEDDDRATFPDDNGKGAYTVKSNRTGKPVSAKTYRSLQEAVSASNAMNEKLPPLKKAKASRPSAKAKA